MDKPKWRQRFEEVIALEKARGRSYRELSRAAKQGTNYVQQLINDEKDPYASKLIAVLNALGTAKTLYVMRGYRFSDEDEEIIELLLDADPSLRDAIRQILVQKRVPESPAGPQPAG